MKKILTIILTIASLSLILDSFNFLVIFLEFFFIGIIPGTNFRFSPNTMFTIILIASGILLGKVIFLPIIKKLTINQKNQLSVNDI